MTWVKVAMGVGGGAVAALALLYYMLKDSNSIDDNEVTDEGNEGETGSSSSGDIDSAFSGIISDIDNLSKEGVIAILKKLIAAQEEVKKIMKNFTPEIIKGKLEIDKIYKKVLGNQIRDPLKDYGISPQVFGKQLRKYCDCPQISELLGKIAGAPCAESIMSDSAMKVSVDTIVEVYSFMLNELTKIIDNFEMSPDKDTYDIQAFSVAAQALVEAKVEEKFKVTSEDIDGAVYINYESLSRMECFHNLGINLQKQLARLAELRFGKEIDADFPLGGRA